VRAAERTGPIGDGELPLLFAPLVGASRIAIAVSGGSDSLALLDCIDRWRRQQPKPPTVFVLTVDHGLRRSSASDARRVVAIARKRGLKAQILRWTGEKPKGDIEAAARAARYRLLLGAARAAKASHLLIAHQRDDQAETLILRLARGSGVFGLAAMRTEMAAGAVTIFRPFLDIARARLQETIAVAGLEPIEDAMNSDPRYARARLRRIMPLLSADGIDAAGLAATAGRLASAAEAIDEAATRVIERVVVPGDLATAAIDAEVFLAVPAEIRLRALVRILIAVGGEDYPPRFERLQALDAEMARHGGSGRFKRTLGGAVIEGRHSRFEVYREVGRMGLPIVTVKAGFSGVWDHRFLVEIGRGAPAGLTLGALGEAGRRMVGAKAGPVPAGVLAALPALWLKGSVFAVPTLGYRPKAKPAFSIAARSLLADRLIAPPRFPDFLGPG
jgi:tRNA(Ile)-lysidine synthase